MDSSCNVGLLQTRHVTTAAVYAGFLLLLTPTLYALPLSPRNTENDNGPSSHNCQPGDANLECILETITPTVYAFVSTADTEIVS